MNIDIAGVPVSAISHVHKNVIRWANDTFDLHKGVFQGVAIVGIAMNRFGTHKPAAATGGGNTDFAAELITLVCFAFADALYSRFVSTVDLFFVFGLLMENTGSNVQQCQ